MTKPCARQRFDCATEKRLEAKDVISTQSELKHAKPERTVVIDVAGRTVRHGGDRLPTFQG